MDNVKKDEYYIQKMIADIEKVIEHMESISYEEFCENEVLQDCVMFRFVQLSENAKKISDEFKKRTQISWPMIYAIRNRIVHEYGTVSLDIIYNTIFTDFPPLLRLLKKLEKEF